MAVTSKQVSVGTTATLIFTADTDGNNVFITMADTGSVYLGGPGVTISTGMLLEHPGGGGGGGGGGHSAIQPPLEIKLGAGEALYGVTGTGTEVVTVLITNF
jgi:hypothetical protein